MLVFDLIILCVEFFLHDRNNARLVLLARLDCQLKPRLMIYHCNMHRSLGLT